MLQPQYRIVDQSATTTAPTRTTAVDDGTTGYIHSFETGSVVDGPGMRFVLWTTGCPMRCQYCHNPDTWKLRNGEAFSVDDVMARIVRYGRLLTTTNGGVTISGGEPLVQTPFVRRVMQACKAVGIHTVLDTNGYLGERLTDEDLMDIDLVLLDIKSFDSETHRHVTGCDVGPVLQFAERLARLQRPVWIRFVLVPGLTDDPSNVEGLADYVAGLGNVEQVDVLPFHQMGRDKWERLGVPYQLHQTHTPDRAATDRVVERFRAYGLNAR